MAKPTAWTEVKFTDKMPDDSHGDRTAEFVGTIIHIREVGSETMCVIMEDNNQRHEVSSKAIQA